MCLYGGGWGGYSGWGGGGLKWGGGGGGGFKVCGRHHSVPMSLVWMPCMYVRMLDLQTRNVEMGCHTILY